MALVEMLFDTSGWAIQKQASRNSRQIHGRCPVHPAPENENKTLSSSMMKMKIKLCHPQ